MQEQSFILQKCETLFLMPQFHFFCTVGSIYIGDVFGGAAVTRGMATNNSIHVLELFPAARLQIHISAKYKLWSKDPEMLFLYFISKCL